MNSARILGLSDQLGKLIPQAVEMEEVVLGAMMLERERIYDVANILRPEDFYKESSKSIMEAIVELFENSKPIDIKTVTHQLRSMGRLEMVGGAAYVAQLTLKVNSAANIETHSRIIKEQSIKRDLISLSAEVQRGAYEDTKDVFNLMDYSFTTLENIQSGIGTFNVESLSGNVMGIIERAEGAKKARDNNEITGIPTGILELDKILGGSRPGDLIYIASRPSMGKTAMATSIINWCYAKVRNLSPIGHHI